MDQDSFDNTQLPSKSQRKREAHQLQELGIRLTRYSEDKLQQLSLPAKLITAIAEFKRLPNSHGARRRQLQFIGKLMRDCEYQALSDTLQKIEHGRQQQIDSQAASLRWAEKILLAGDEPINDAIKEYPGLERQKLRQLYRDYQSADETSRQNLQLKLQEYLQEYLLP